MYMYVIVIESFSGKIMSVSPALSYILGGGLVWSIAKTAEVVTSPLNSIDALQHQKLQHPDTYNEHTSHPSSGVSNTSEYVAGNEWSGPEGKNHVRVKGPVSLRGPLKLRSATNKPSGRRGVIVHMPYSTGYTWSIYSYMDGYYGPLGIERLFQQRLYTVALISHLCKDLLVNKKYNSFMIIASTIVPQTIESRSAFFRLLCNIEDAALFKEEGEEEEDCTSSDLQIKFISEIVNNILTSLKLNNLNYTQLKNKLNQSICGNYVYNLIEKEMAVMPPTNNDLVVSVLASNILNQHYHIKDAVATSILQNKLEKVFEFIGPELRNNFEFPSSGSGTIKLKQLIIGAFSGFLMVDRRDIAALIAIVFLHRIDIACLCLKSSSLSHEEAIRLVEFSCNINTYSEPQLIEGMEDLYNKLVSICQSSGSKPINSKYIESVCEKIKENF